MISILQEGIKDTINAKKTTIERFAGIQNMWIGADFWPVDGKWKWRNSYIDFDGIDIFLYLELQL